MSGGKIILDSETFRALSSETRIRLLRLLENGRRTLTDLSNETGLAKPTVQFHLENLMKVDLILKENEGRKWLYYSLTRKGRSILNPGVKKIQIILALSVTFLGIGIVMLSSHVLNGEALDKVATGGTGEPVQSLLVSWQLIAGIVMIVSAIILALCAGMLRHSSKRIVEGIMGED